MTIPSTAGFTVTVYGVPAPQGSKRHVGRGIMIESSKKVAPWREAVKFAARSVIDDLPDFGILPLDGPLRVSMIFTLARPKSATRKRRHPDRTPDLSKLIRATEDALTDAGVWADDARVVEYVPAAKVYVGMDPRALPVPGAVINVWEVVPSA